MVTSWGEGARSKVSAHGVEIVIAHAFDQVALAPAVDAVCGLIIQRVFGNDLLSAQHLVRGLQAFLVIAAAGGELLLILKHIAQIALEPGIGHAVTTLPSASLVS